MKSLRRQQLSPSPMVVRLSFDTEKSPTPPRSRTRSGRESTESSVMERGFLHQSSTGSDMAGTEESSTPAPDRGPPLVAVCRELITGALNRFKGQSPRESVADRVLHSCEMVQSAITSMLDSYNKYTEDNNGRGTPFIYTLQYYSLNQGTYRLYSII